MALVRQSAPSIYLRQPYIFQITLESSRSNGLDTSMSLAPRGATAVQKVMAAPTILDTSPLPSKEHSSIPLSPQQSKSANKRIGHTGGMRDSYLPEHAPSSTALGDSWTTTVDRAKHTMDAAEM